VVQLRMIRPSLEYRVEIDNRNRFAALEVVFIGSANGTYAGS